jgi:S1-C subfamily serine protease
VFIGLGGGGNQRFRLVVKQGKGGQIMFVQNGDQKQNEALKKYGLEGYAVDDTLVRRQLQLADGRGFGVTKVLPNTAAARLGLEAYDIVIAIGDRPVKGVKQVVKALGKKEAWDALGMRILRAGQIVKLGPPQPR